MLCLIQLAANNSELFNKHPRFDKLLSYSCKINPDYALQPVFMLVYSTKSPKFVEWQSIN
jgi:hypothetical protein